MIVDGLDLRYKVLNKRSEEMWIFLDFLGADEAVKSKCDGGIDPLLVLAESCTTELFRSA